jgi:TonB-linked SusC/RagA family outer membrane protein
MKKNPDSIDRRLYGILSKNNIRAMKMTIVLMMLTICQIWAVESYSQSAKISLKLEDAKISEALKAIEDQTEFYFLYSPKLIDVEREVDIDAENETVDKVLAQLFGNDISKVVYDRQIVLSPKDRPVPVEVTLQKTVTGIVYDSNRNPLPGVTVVLKGSSTGTFTNSEGKFTIMIDSDEDIIVFSFIGMKTIEEIVGDRATVEVVMEEDLVQLDEIIAIGYMTQRKADLTGAVSVITKSNLENNSYSNVLKAIQGKVAGVNILTDGDPASDVNINIRGITSINSSSPLLVIDGVASTSNLRDLNPNDIESIQILKDAASASIYGSRAASGVILVNTLQAKKGDLNVNYDAKFSTSNVFNKPDLLNTEDWGRAHWMAMINDGLDPNEHSEIYDYEWHYDDEGIAVLDKVTPVEWLNSAQTQKSTDTDWWDEVFKPAFQQDHQLTVLHGTEKSSTMFSLNYLHENGNIITNYQKKFSIRLNTSFNLLEGKLKVGENLNILNRNYISNVGGITQSVVWMHPMIPVYDLYGGYGGSSREFGMDEHWNPVSTLESNKDNPTRALKIIGNIFAELNLFKGLTFRSQFGIDNSNGYSRYVKRIRVEAGGLIDPKNTVQVSASTSNDWVWTNTLNYSISSFNHDVNVVAGAELFHHYNESANSTRDDILMETRQYAYFNSATGVMNVTGIGDEYALISYFGKVNYSFMNRYLLSLTGRFDGSSKFPEANRFGFFPAVSLGWRLTEENFMNFLPATLSDLKLRLSWGVNGNSYIPTNGILTTFGSSYDLTSYSLSGAESGQLPSGYYALHIGNPNLKWESTTQTNLGLDVGVFNNRLIASMEYYHKITTDMLFEPAANPIFGEGAEMWINAADMTNNGFEAVVSYNSSLKKDFVYSVSGNISISRNKIDHIPEGLELEYGGNGLDDNILGRPLRSVYGFVYDGIFKTQDEVLTSPEQPGKDLGRMRYKDLDGDGQITWEHDRTWIGNYDPDFLFGIDFTSSYKSFDFSMFWQGVVGNDVYNDYLYLTDYINLRNQPYQNHVKGILDAWSPANPDSDKPALTNFNTNEEGRPSTYFIQDGSYLKLRSIEIGYTLPSHVCKRIFMKNLRVYVSAQNLITIKKGWGDDAFTGLDPEISDWQPNWSAYMTAETYFTNYPRPSIFTFGIQSTL